MVFGDSTSREIGDLMDSPMASSADELEGGGPTPESLLAFEDRGVVVEVVAGTPEVFNRRLMSSVTRGLVAELAA